MPEDLSNSFSTLDFSHWAAMQTASLQVPRMPLRLFAGRCASQPVKSLGDLQAERNRLLSAEGAGTEKTRCRKGAALKRPG